MAEEKRIYVTNAAWVSASGRADAIDEIADQFERPTVADGAATASGAEEFWSPAPGHRWPRPSNGWRSMSRLTPRLPERRAG